MFLVEGRHWWYRGMEAITRAILDRCYPAGADLRILDAGCGTGAAMATCLAVYGRVTGVDISPLALDFCRLRKTGALIRASVMRLPFASGTFDLITSFDVLYACSVPDDAGALAELARLLARGGRLLLRLPAYDWLRGRHDAAVDTARRYTRSRVAELLGCSGLAVELLSYANMFLFPAALAKRTAERLLPSRRAGSDLEYGFGPANGFLRSILALEAPLVARRGLPFGLSVFALGRKA